MAESTIRELAARLRRGELSAVELAEHYLRRIAEIDQAGPGLRSVIEVNPDALQIAAALDAERRARGARGPLHGIPILLKDNIDTGDRMQTTAGSLALLGSPAAKDSAVARKLRAAGAVILGKTNLSEWANFRSSHSVSGWSSRGGQTLNPYALDRNPCGSSSGSGVAVAADLCAAAVGTETDGSIVCPANANGIVGLKPTLGLVSRAGIVPIAHSQDTAGPMTRTVHDAAVLLDALAGPDPADPATLEAPSGRADRYVAALDRAALHGARLGVARNFLGFHPDVDRVMEEALAALRAEGAELVDVDLTLPKGVDDGELEVLLWEFRADLNAYLAGRGPDCPVHSMADVVRFNEQHAEQVMPYFGQEYMLQAEARRPEAEEAYRRALTENRSLTREAGIDRVLGEHGLAAIVAPTGGPAWLTDYVNRDHFSGGSSTPAAVAGYPNITVPAGFVHGLPVGISFFAGAWSEPTLLALAYAFEQATQARRPPRFLRSIEW